jgi:hypothetical protein
MITGETKIRDKRSALEIANRQDNRRIPSLRALLVDDGSPILSMLQWHFKDPRCSVTTAFDPFPSQRSDLAYDINQETC